jgi:hypothetical protein
MPFSIQELPSSKCIYPPILRHQQGHPKSKRYRKGDHKKKHKKYGTCNEKGHDKRTCRNQPVANRWRQRARDQELLSSSDSSLDIQQSEIVRETDDDSNDLQAQLEQDLQFQAEIQAFEARLDQHDTWWSNQLSEADERAAAATLLSHGPIESSADENGSGNCWKDSYNPVVVAGHVDRPED